MFEEECNIHFNWLHPAIRGVRHGQRNSGRQESSIQTLHSRWGRCCKSQIISLFQYDKHLSFTSICMYFLALVSQPHGHLNRRLHHHHDIRTLQQIDSSSRSRPGKIGQIWWRKSHRIHFDHCGTYLLYNRLCHSYDIWYVYNLAVCFCRTYQDLEKIWVKAMLHSWEIAWIKSDQRWVLNVFKELKIHGFYWSERCLEYVRQLLCIQNYNNCGLELSKNIDGIYSIFHEFNKKLLSRRAELRIVHTTIYLKIQNKLSLIICYKWRNKYIIK